MRENENAKPPEDQASPTRTDLNANTLIVNAEALIGKTLGGCKILQVIQAGAMGVIYAAHHIELDREVAVKVPRPSEKPLTDADRERFSREARLSAIGVST